MFTRPFSPVSYFRLPIESTHSSMFPNNPNEMRRTPETSRLKQSERQVQNENSVIHIFGTSGHKVEHNKQETSLSQTFANSSAVGELANFMGDIRQRAAMLQKQLRENRIGMCRKGTDHLCHQAV